MPIRTLRRTIELARHERAAGAALTIATIAALAWANTGGDSYRLFADSARDVVNDGLMTAFFLVVGLEIRREMVAGELGSLRRAATPLVAAVAGMVVPALIYAALVREGAASGAWAIPMATDIAFALGAIALVGSDLSLRVRTFLLTLSVADDVLAIIVLVAFYEEGFSPLPLLGGVVALASIVVIHRLSRGYAVLSTVAAILAWVAFHRAGIEPALVGFPVGLLLPTKTLGPRRLERMLQPWLVVVILPVFALANVGIRIDLDTFVTGSAGVVFLGVFLARVVGKPLGIGMSVALMRRSHRMYPEPHEEIGHFVSAGAIAAAGLTVPLIVVELALPEGPQADAARVALLVASVVAVGVGWFIHLVTDRSPARDR